MAAANGNDVLKIEVQVVEDNKKNVDDLVRKVQLALDKDFKLKVSDDGAVNKLEEMKGILTGVHKQLQDISNGLRNSNWGQFSSDLNIMISNFRNLTQTAEKFGAAMSKSFANSLTSEINELLPKLSQTSQMLEQIKNESRKGDGSGGILASEKSIREAETSLKEVLKLIRNIEYVEKSLGGKGFDTTGISSYRDKLLSIAKAMDEILKSNDGLSKSGLNATEVLRKEGFIAISDAINKETENAKALNAELQKMSDLQAKLEVLSKSLSDSNPHKSSIPSAVSDIAAMREKLIKDGVQSGSEDRNRAMMEYTQLIKDAKKEQKELDAAEKGSANRQKTDLDKRNDAISELIRKMENLQRLASERGITNNGRINSFLGQAESYKNELLGMTSGTPNKEVLKELNDEYRELLKALKSGKIVQEQEASVTRGNAEAKQRAAKRTEELREKERQLAQAMKQTTQSASVQSQIIGDLRSMATQYLSIWGASSFIQSMAQITGELELQQKSLEVIIGSASYASQLFGEIRDLSQQSPYTFQDLLKSTRQLAAFGIQTKDLYGTMKALSDIGAGLSVDVQRLILAYGHTKSYGYLSGIQNRQFETAGIDLVGALTDRYNKLADAEERAGRAAEHVTRKDVFKKISKKEVDFEDVNAVIMELDQPGGKFYNMQERQFDTLGGKLRNLRNNYNIMMAEMGKDNHGMLMGGVNMLNELTEHWDKYARMVKSILIPLGMFKLATIATNTAIGEQTNAMAKNVMMMTRQQHALSVMNNELARSQITKASSLFSYFGAGFGSQGAFTPSNKDARAFTRTLKNGLADGSLSKMNLMYMGLNKDMPHIYRRIALSLAEVDAGQRKVILSAGRMKLAWMRLRLSAFSLGAALRGVAASMGAMLMNPMTWIMAAAAGMTYLWQRASSLSEKVEELARNQREQAENDQKEAQDIMDKHVKKAGVNRVNIGEASYGSGYMAQQYRLDFSGIEKDKKVLEGHIEEIKMKLQAMSPLYNGDLFDIYKVEDQVEQFKTIAEKLKNIEYAHEVEKVTADAIESGLKDTIDGWWIFSEDGLIEDVKDFGESLHNSLVYIDKLSENDVNDLQRTLGNIGRSGIREEAIKRILSGKNLHDEKTGFFFERANQTSIFKSTTDRLDDAKNEFAEFADDLDKIIEAHYGKDSGGAATYLISRLQAINSAAEITDPETQNMVMSAALETMREKMKVNGKNAIDEALRQMIKEHAMTSFDAKRMTGRETLEQVNEVLNDVSNETIKWGERMGIDMKRIGMDTAEAYRDGVQSVLNQIAKEQQWKRNLLYVGGDRANADTDAGRLLGTIIKNSSNYHQLFGEDLKKEYDALNKEIGNALPDIKKTLGIEIVPDLKFNYKNLNKLKEFRTKLLNYINSNPALREEREEKYKDVLENMEKQEVLIQLAHDAGYDYEDTKKNKGGRGTNKDREYELWEQRVKIIQEARREYDYWEKAVGKESAQEKVRNQFGNLIGDGKDPMKPLKKGDLDNLEKYADVLKQVNEEAEKREKKLAKTNQKKWSDLQKLQHNNDLKILRDIDKTMHDIEKMEFEKSTERFVSGMTRALDDLTRRWDIFNSIREKIGNDDVAARLAGLTPLDRSKGVVFKSDAMKEELEAYMRENASSVGSVDYAKVLGLDEDGLKDYVQGLFREVTKGLEKGSEELKGYEERIKYVVDALKKWQGAERDLQKESASKTSELLGKMEDFESVVARIKKRAEDDKDLIRKSNATKEEKNELEAIVDANRDWEIWQKSTLYLNMMNRALAMTHKELEVGIKGTIEALDKRLQTGAMSAAQYAEELNKIHKIQRDIDLNGSVFGNGAFGAFAKGGVNGAINWYDNAITNRIAELGKDYITDGNGKYIGNDEKLIRLLGKREAWEKTQKGLAGVANVSQVVMGALNGLQQAAQSLGEMFEALGNKKMADKFSDVADGIGGVSDMFSGISGLIGSVMNGDIGGVASNAILTPVKLFTGPITAFSKLHDKKNERKIDEIGRDIVKIGNTLDTIRSLREEELGYAKGDNIRELASMYRTQKVNVEKNLIDAMKSGGIKGVMRAIDMMRGSAVNAGMEEYYGRALGSGADSSYQMEYNMLNEERKLKMQQYNAEADKKNQDDAKLEEYKKGIAELDLQIQQFATNLMKDLWGIDFKQWASQISDALMTAFENGENSAKAFKDAMADIMRSVVKNMINMAVIEPFVNRLKDKLVGDNGLITANQEDFMNNPEKYTGRIVSEIGKWYNTDGKSMVTAASQIYNGMDDLLGQYDIELNQRKDSGSNSISQQITEETAGYMTGILAAMHQDGSVRRLMLQTIVGEQMPNVIEMMTVSGGHIAGIDENTRAIMHMMQDGSGKMYERIADIGTKLDRFAKGFDRVTVA